MPKLRIDHKILLAALKYPTAGLRHPDIDRAEMEMNGRIRPPAGWIPADGGDIEWARKQGLPVELIKVFEDGWPNATTEIGPWARLCSLAAIRKESNNAPGFLAQGFLYLGSALNGDFIVMDLQNHFGAIGYLRMCEVLLGVEGPRNNQRLLLCDHLRQEFFEISPSLGAFALGVVKDALPVDSYATWSEENEKASWFDGLDDEGGI